MNDKRGIDGFIDLNSAAEPKRSLIGGKAAGLVPMVAAGLPVPSGCVIPTGITDEAIDDLAVAVADRFEGKPVAIRSSGVAEDLEGSSQAGRYESILGVEPEASAVAAAIRRVLASAESGRTTDRGNTAEMAVLIMEMVDAEVAGIAFTRDPVTGKDVVVIEAAAGLGDRLASGGETGERWLVDGHSKPESSASLLTATQAESIAALARDAESIAGSPQDIEWALADGRLYLLQSRPITALPLEPTDRPPPGQTWVRDVTHNRGAMTRLGFSAWLPGHTEAWRKTAAKLGIPFETMDHRILYGRSYDRFVPLGSPSKDRPLPPGPILKLLTRLVPIFRRRLKTAAMAAAEDLPMRIVEEWEETGRDALVGETRRLREVDLSALDDEELAGHIEEVVGHLHKVGTDHITVGAAGTFVLTGQLGLLMEEFLGWEPHRAIDLVQGHGGASAAAGRALDSLAVSIAEDEVASRLLEDDPLGLLDHPGPGGTALRAFLETHGHRAPNVQLNEPTWAEDPRPLFSLLKGAFGKSRIDEAMARSAAAEEEALQELSDQYEVEAFERALARARRGRPCQDETEILLFDALAVLRYTALEAARRFVERGVLSSSVQVFHLDINEVPLMLRGGNAPSDIGRREAEFRWALANIGPDVIGPEPQPPPSRDLFPESVRDTVGAFLWVTANLYFVDRSEDAEVDGQVRGLPASPGRATGPARVIEGPADFHRIENGDILVCESTMASWSPVFSKLAGVVTETGGPLSHPATLAREYGLPAVLSVAEARSRFGDGQQITVDGSAGTIEV